MKRRAFLAAAGLAASPPWIDPAAETQLTPAISPDLPADVLKWARYEAGLLRRRAEEGEPLSADTLMSAADTLERMVELWEQAFFKGNPPICAKGHCIVGDNVRLSMHRVGENVWGDPTYRHVRVCRKCYLGSRLEDEGMRG